MSIYSLALNQGRDIVNVGAAAWDIVCTGGTAAIHELSVTTRNNAAGSCIGFGRSPNTPVQLGQVRYQQNDPKKAGISRTFSSVTWTTAPTSPTQFFRRSFVGLSGWPTVWTWPRGFTLPRNVNFNIWVLGIGGSGSLETTGGGSMYYAEISE